MKYVYTAYDQGGKLVRDALEATTLADATEMLRRKGLFPDELVAEGESASNKSSGKVSTVRSSKRMGGRNTRLRDMATLMRQLSVLVSTGTPMVEAIGSLHRQLPESHWKSVVHDIQSRIEQGSSLSSALSEHPQYFDAVCRSLIAAGESGGQLDEMLARLSALTRQQIKVISTIRGAMVYPMLLTCIAGGVLATMLLFVLPRFKSLFDSLGAPLPPTTKMLMDLSAMVRGYWWAVGGGGIALGIGLKMWLKTTQAIEFIANVQVKMPQFGKIYRNFATARICRVLGVLLEGKVPLLEALGLARECTGNICYERLMAKAQDEVTRGESISGAFEVSPLVSKSVVEAIRSGERSGKMGMVLTSLADFIEEDNEIVLKSLSSIIEPLILMVLGVVIGFVAISMFMPLFDVATATQSGAHR